MTGIAQPGRRAVAGLLAGCVLWAVLAAAAAGAENPTQTFSGTGAQQRAIAIDDAGYVYTALGASQQISRMLRTDTASVQAGWAGGLGATPNAIAVGKDGNLYVTAGSTVAKVTPAGNVTELANIGSQSQGITQGPGGDLFVAGGGSVGTITRVTLLGTYSTWASVGNSPIGIVMDGSGAAYTANEAGEGGGDVTRVSPDGTQTSTIGPTGAGPYGIVADSAGKVFTANHTSGDVSKITPPSSVIASWANSGGDQPYAITIDSAFNLYVANYNANTVHRISPDGTNSLLASTGTGPFAITIDADGYLYTANYGGGSVTRIAPSGLAGPVAPAPPDVPAAPAAAAGQGSATVTINPNASSARFGAPSSYTVRAVENQAKGCTVTPPATACTVTGLTAATSYTFSARANLNSWETAFSPASNAVTPSAPDPTPDPDPDPTPDPTPDPPAPERPKGKIVAKGRAVTATIRPAVTGVSYSISAQRVGGARSVSGYCRARRSRTVECRVRLGKGRWRVAVTPRKDAVNGPALARALSIR